MKESVFNLPFVGRVAKNMQAAKEEDLKESKSDTAIKSSEQTN